MITLVMGVNFHMRILILGILVYNHLEIEVKEYFMENLMPQFNSSIPYKAINTFIKFPIVMQIFSVSNNFW